MPKEIDPKLVEDAAAIGCTQEEIATLVHCSVDTLQRRFKQEMADGLRRMRASIKRAQYEVGVTQKNPTMLIWLGKQHLGQRDVFGLGNADDRPFQVAISREEIIGKLLGPRATPPAK